MVGQLPLTLQKLYIIIINLFIYGHGPYKKCMKFLYMKQSLEQMCKIEN